MQIISSPKSGLRTTISQNVFPKINRFGGLDVRNFKYVLYNKIHTIKDSYNFGNISNDSTNTFELWNAYQYKDVTIDNIEFDALSGVELLDQNQQELILPIDIRHLTSQVFTIKVLMEGDSSNDGNILITIGDVTSAIAVSVSRTVLFDFNINAINNIKEHYLYNTRIIPSMNNTEQRLSRLDIPRVTYEYFYSLSDKEKRMMDAYIYSNNTNLSLPIYTQTRDVISIVDNIVTIDITNTCIQVGMDVLIKDIYSKEVIKVSRIIDNNHIELRSNLTNIYTSPVLIPLISAKMPSTVNKIQKTKNFSEYSIIFDKNIDSINTLVTNNNSSQFNKYKNIYLLEESNTTDDIDYSFEKDIITNDNGYSKIEQTMLNNVATVSFNYSMYATSKDEISKIKNLFKNQKGMFQDLYSRSMTNNIKVVENISANDIIITVENNSLTTFYKNNKIKQIYFKYNDNVEKIIGITDIYKIDDNKEAIILESGFGVNITVENMISSDFVFLGRLNADMLTIEYSNHSFARYDLQFIKNNDVG